VEKSSRIIAVVDDEAPVRVALRRLLAAVGFGVETCASGGEFMEAFADRRFDCLVLDLHMPLMDGFEVLARLSDSERRPPIVVLTGHDSPETRRRVSDAGVTTYVTKPVKRRELLKAIDQAISQRGGN
jgi:FixJ family two-component response regulator